MQVFLPFPVTGLGRACDAIATYEVGKLAGGFRKGFLTTKTEI